MTEQVNAWSTADGKLFYNQVDAIFHDVDIAIRKTFADYGIQDPNVQQALLTYGDIIGPALAEHHATIQRLRKEHGLDK